MNEAVNKLLLAGYKFIPEMHFKQARFTYSVCGPFFKNKERMKNIKEPRDSRYIHQNKLDEACFQDDMGYGDFKDLNRTIAVDKVLRVKHLTLPNIRNMMDINLVILQWFIHFLIKSF